MKNISPSRSDWCRLTSSVKKRPFRLGLSFLIFLRLASAQASDNDWPRTIRSSNWNSFVYINVKIRHENGATEVSTGTGFIVHPDGWLMTCNHVIPKTSEGDTITINLTVGDRQDPSFLNDAIKRDEQEDLALLKLPTRDAGPWHVIGSVGEIDTESEVVAFGYPLTEGLVSKNGRITNKNGKDGKWVTDTPVNPGMSGGPVFDPKGSVVAVVEGGYEEAQSLNLVVPISFARGLLQKVNSPLLVGSKVLPPPITVEAPVIYGDRVSAVIGEEFGYSIRATGSPTKYSASGLPPGLTVDRDSGDISGTVEDESRSVYTANIQAQNEGGWGKKERLVIRVVQRKNQIVAAAPTPYPTDVAPQITAGLSQFIFQNGVFSVQGVNAYAPNGAFIGYLTGPNIQGSVATLSWTNGTASHFMADGAIVNLFPNGTAVVGRWR